MRVLITRPGDDGKILAEALNAIGVQSVIEPLMSIKYSEGAELDLAGVQAVLVTSANGVRALARRSPRRDIPIYAVGDASAGAASDVGFENIHTASGDVAALADLVAKDLDAGAGPLVHVAATALAGDLAGDLAARGFETRREILYEAEPVRAFSASAIAGLKDGAFDTVLLYSPRTAEILLDLIRKARLVRVCRQLNVVALSQAVADALDGSKWKNIFVASEPTQIAIIERLKNLSGSEISTGGDRNFDAEVSSGAEPPLPAASNVPNSGPARPAQPSVAKPRTMRTIFYTLLVVIVLGGAAILFWPQLEPYAESVFPLLAKGKNTQIRLDDIAARLNQVERDNTATLPELEELLAEKDRLQSKLKQSLDRIEKLESSIEGIRRMVGEAGDRSGGERAQLVGKLAQRLAEIEKSRADTAAGTSQRMDNIDQRIAQLGRQPLAEEQARSRAARLVSTLGRLSDTIKRGEPFASELEFMQSQFGGDAEIVALVELLSPGAASGIETQGRLKDRFSALAGKLVRVEKLPQGDGWLERTLGRLTQSVKWRRIDDLEGSGIEAIVARTERALGRGDVAQAIIELNALPSEAAAEAMPWLKDATLLVSAERRLAKLRISAMTIFEEKSTPK
ncbi:MAG: uroporphyrinogen-III synthase [Rhodospirillales bacterium]|nr:uroporphyrinogen-III synthase [Rhodospirillales bacterium]